MFPYAEWALFDRGGVVHEGATEGAGGRYFDLASLTKTFTATAILTTVKAGLLSLEDDAGRLPGRDFLRGMSVRRLMTHTAGLPAWYPFYADGRPFFEALEALLKERGRGEGMVYSDLSYMLLGLVLEEVTGKPLEEAIDPLGFGVMYRPGKGLDLVPSCRDNAVEEGMCEELGMSFAGFRPHCTDVVVNRTTATRTISGTMSAAMRGFSARRGWRGARALLSYHRGPHIPRRRDASAGLRWALPHLPHGRGLPDGLRAHGFHRHQPLARPRTRHRPRSLTNRLYYDHKPTADMNSFRRSVHEALLETI